MHHDTQQTLIGLESKANTSRCVLVDQLQSASLGVMSPHITFAIQSSPSESIDKQWWSKYRREYVDYRPQGLLTRQSDECHKRLITTSAILGNEGREGIWNPDLKYSKERMPWITNDRNENRMSDCSYSGWRNRVTECESD